MSSATLLDLSTRIANAAVVLRRMRKAALREPWTGRAPDVDDELRYMRRHTWDTEALSEPGRPTRVMLTLDVGTHASGWWRNSDYDRCLHLSVSHAWLRLGNLSGRIVDHELEACSDAEVRAWAEAAFGEHRRKSWFEPPAGTLDPYRLAGVWHVRLFLDRHDEPIQPEGEVYTLKPWDDGSSPEKVFRS